MVSPLGPNPLSTGVADFAALRADLLAAAALLSQEQKTSPDVAGALQRQISALLTTRVDAAQLATVAALLGIDLPAETHSALVQSQATSLPFTPLDDVSAAVADAAPLADAEIDAMLRASTTTPNTRAQYVSKLVRPSVFADQIVGAPQMLGTTSLHRDALVSQAQRTPLVFAVGDQKQPMHVVILNNNLNALSSLKPKAFASALAMLLRQALVDSFGQNPPVDVRVSADKSGHVTVSYLSTPQLPTVGASIADNVGFALLAKPDSATLNTTRGLFNTPLSTSSPADDSAQQTPPSLGLVDEKGNRFSTATRDERQALAELSRMGLPAHASQLLGTATPTQTPTDEQKSGAWRDVFAILRNTPTTREPQIAVTASPTTVTVQVQTQTTAATADGEPAPTATPTPTSTNAGSSNGVTNGALAQTSGESADFAALATATRNAATPNNRSVPPNIGAMTTNVTVTSHVVVEHRNGDVQASINSSTRSADPGPYSPAAWYAGWWNTSVQQRWSGSTSAGMIGALGQKLLVTLFGLAVGAFVVSVGLATDPAIALVVVGLAIGAIAATSAQQLWRTRAQKQTDLGRSTSD